MAKRMTQNEARKRLGEALKKVKRVYLADHISSKQLRDVEMAIRACYKQVNRK